MHPDAAARADGTREPAPPDVAIAERHDPRALQLLRADVIGHGTVPSAPEVLLEILQLLEDDAGDMRRLFSAIERDPGLTAKVLRTANGSFFGQSRTVDSIERATLVLGVAMVRSLAISAAVFDRVGGALPAAFVDRIWRHSLATATVARALATRVSADRDEAFTAGLLHDAGMMLLLRRHPDLYRGRDVDAPTEDVEREAVGVDHGVVGGWLFDAWRLPTLLVDAVAQHHAEVPSEGLGSVIWAASLIARDPEAALLAGGDAPRADAARAAASTFGLTPETWTEIAAGPRRGGRS